jgi:hypothetical protein
VTFAFSENGHVVRAPGVVGDIICILDGAAIPTVIRPILTDGSTPTSLEGHRVKYSFIGPAYWHGLMDGEVTNFPEYTRQLFSLV